VKPLLRRLIAGAFGVLGTVAGAQSLDGAEQLLFSPPAGFKLGHRAEQGATTLAEFVPKDQSVDDWTEMITIQIFRRPAFTAAELVRGVSAKIAAACPATTGGPQLNGNANGYAVSMISLSCPVNVSTGKPETLVMRAINGGSAVYSMQRAWRSTASRQQLGEAFLALGHINVCDPRTTEHPCQAPAPAAESKAD
jgi:hypothetical protein